MKQNKNNDLLMVDEEPKKRRSVRCPECKSTDTAKIIYGMHDIDDELEKKLKEGKVWLGGCNLTGDDPIRHCNNCKSDY
ncbi:MAG: hypothetical protein ACI9BF_000807 [Candidatus Paceibacteria bacterium]|jgi:hypothetical protein